MTDAMTLTMALLISLLVLTCLIYVSNAAGAVAKDKAENCEELVADGMCRKDVAFMRENCQVSCGKWLEGLRKVEVEHVTDDEPSFFDLEAKNSTGSTLSFERFEGYITLVVNAAKSCVAGVTEKAFQNFENLQQIWPYTLEIIVFPFEHPGINYHEAISCESHEQAVKKKGRKIHVMEQVSINGKNTHAVYKYLKEKFKIDEMENDYATFFLVTPNGDTIEAHHGATSPHIKDYIRLHLERDL